MGSDKVVEMIIAKVGEENKEGHVFTEKDLEKAAMIDDSFVFDKKKGILKVVIRLDDVANSKKQKIVTREGE